MNAQFAGRPYTWFYIVDGVFKQASKIVKINVDTRQIGGIYEAGQGIAISANPVFVADPSGSREDDGLIVVRALDMRAKTGSRLRLGL